MRNNILCIYVLNGGKYLKLLSSQCSFQGGRKYNEDSILFQQDGENIVAIVADGLGGCGGGDIASHIVIETLSKLFLENPEISQKHIQKIFEETNKNICIKQKNGIRMKSTAVGYFYNGRKFAVAHIGDSRFYHFRQGKIIFKTKDHSVPQMLVQVGEIKEEEIRFHEDRNKILRALGSEGRVRVEINVWNETMKTGDAFLLCSDGFWEYVWENEMIECLSKSMEPSQWIQLMIQKVEERAEKNNDNFSAIAIFCIPSAKWIRL